MKSESGERASGLARKIGSRTGGASGAVVRSGTPRRAWTLRVLPASLAFPLIVSLVAGNVTDVLGLAVALVACYAATLAVEAGLREEADFAGRTIAKAPKLPKKILGALLLGGGVFAAAYFGSTSGLPLSLLLAGVGVAGCLMAYGLDPREDKGIDPALAARAGVKLETVVEAVTEAEGKLAEIDQAAAGIRNRELRDHLHRITTEGRNILLEIERDPGDIRRARRFLVTYLDGTRDVVKKYAAQQKDLADSPLGENFKHVLGTIETVFAEQIDVLKKNESLDLEVQIDVLKTQLEREGVA